MLVNNLLPELPFKAQQEVAALEISEVSELESMLREEPDILLQFVCDLLPSLQMVS